MTGNFSSEGEERVVAVGLLTERDLGVLGQGFRRIYRIENCDDFRDLVDAIDRADRAQQERMIEAKPRLA